MSVFWHSIPRTTKAVFIWLVLTVLFWLILWKTGVIGAPVQEF